MNIITSAVGGLLFRLSVLSRKQLSGILYTCLQAINRNGNAVFVTDVISFPLRFFRQFLPIIIWLIIFQAKAVSGELLVIVAQNHPVQHLSEKKLANVYRKKTLIMQQGIRWAPINLAANDPLRQAFSKKIFKQRPEEMELYWNIQYFKGITPPYVVTSQEAMLRFIVSTPGAIGYVQPCYLNSQVRVIIKLSVEGSFAGCPETN